MSRAASTQTVSLARTASATARPTPRATRGVSNLLCITTDPRKHQQRPGEPGEVVVIDPARQVLRLRKKRDQRRRAHRQTRPEREKPACHGVNGEDGEHAERDGEQPDQPRIVAGELGDHRPEQVVQGRLLPLGLTRRRQPEVIRDAGDVVEVGELVGRRADRGDARVRNGEPGEDDDERPEHHPVEVPDAPAHGSCETLSARTQTVYG